MGDLYAKMSKLVGWNVTDVKIPPLREAEQLLEGVRHKDTEAIEQVIRINRFAPLPEDDAEVEALNTILQARTEASKL
jgi:hypothetical protein